MNQEQGPIDVLVLEARNVAAGASRDAAGASRDVLLRCARMIEVLAREANAYAETIDNVRKALGQKETHYLVVADDVKELVDAVELCHIDGGCRAMTVLQRLRERGP